MTDFTNKKIAVLGFGINGLDVCNHLKNTSSSLTVFDRKSDLDTSSLTAKNIKYVFGPHYLDRGLDDFDLIFRSPGFRPDIPALAEARKRGIIITSPLQLFFDLCPATIIGVTGTKGKGTTSTLINNILKTSGKDAYLAGNIGDPVLALLPKLTKNSYVVLELSSFQLQDLTTSPHIAVVLFIASEHLDYHKDFDEYLQAKANIVAHQQPTDYAVFNADNTYSFSFAKLTSAQKYYFSRFQKVKGAYVINQQIYLDDKIIGPTAKLLLRGEHNWDNVCAAITASYLAGADIASITKAIYSFIGLKHRLELVAETNNIKFINDSFSTTPETTIAAVKAFFEPIILIAGGSDKGSDYTQMGQEIAASSVKTLVLIGLMAEKIRTAVLQHGYKGNIIFRPADFNQAVFRAYQQARPGDIILLSPACASFDMFNDYKDRGEQFRTYAQAIKN